MLYKILGLFFPLHAVIAAFSKWKQTTKTNDTSIDTGVLFELRVWGQLEVILHPQRNVVYCLICNEFLLLWLFCYHSVSHFVLGAKFMISPLATSLLRSRTVCWGKGKDCSEAVPWLFAGTHPPENSAAAISVRRFLTRGGHLGEFHCATCINVIYKDTNKWCLLQHSTSSVF